MEIITRPDETETKMVVISGGTLMKFLRRLAWVATFIREMTRQDGGSRLVLFEEENQSRSLCPSAVCFARVTSVQTIPNIISLNIERTRPNPAFVFFFVNQIVSVLFLYHLLFSVVSFLIIIVIIIIELTFQESSLFYPSLIYFIDGRIQSDR